MRLLFLSALMFIVSVAQAGVFPQALHDALLNAKLANLPPGVTSAEVKEIGKDASAGLIGQVDIILKGNDPKARIGYFVFIDFNAASAFNRKHLPPQIPGQKLLAYPPMARCADIPNVAGYCDLWIQDDGVILTASASRVNGGAAVLMGIGFKHLSAIYENLARQPAPPPKPGGVGACALVTKDEVVTALRQQVKEPEPDQVGGCNWFTNYGDALTVQVFDTGRTGFDAAKSHSIGTTALSGIGDEAFAFVSLAGFVQIDLIKNNHYVAITLQSQRDPNKLETAKALATKIASRL